jgi:hypothetical protein
MRHATAMLFHRMAERLTVLACAFVRFNDQIKVIDISYNGH